MHQQAAQATWNPERDLWETDAMDLFSGHSDAYSETFPISGMTRSGRLFLHPQSVPHMPGSASSSSPGLPAPRATRGGGATETVDLLRTPCAAEAEGGMLHPNKAEREGQTLRLSSQIVHMVAPDQLKDDLLPTPCASPSGNTPEEHLRKKPGRERVTDLSILVENDLLATGGKLLPTPLAGDADNGNVNDPASRRSQGRSVGMQNVAPTIVDSFGPYADAIARWEAVMGRPAPAPTELTAKGKHRLSAKFVEWMMGQSEGWVTDEELGLSRVQQLRALGNGVVTQQAVFAINWLLERAQDQRRKAA